MSISERFWQKVEFDGHDNCWSWAGVKNNFGYGRIKVKGKMILAHRIAWGFIYGTIPDEKQILHHCDNSSCVNPRHLYCGTRFDNMQDMIRRGRFPSRAGKKNPNHRSKKKDRR